MTDKMTDLTGSEIAVIGMAGKFPGAKNIEEYWENLKNGVESLTFISDEEIKNIDPAWLKNPNYVKSMGGALEDRGLFDASFFGYTSKEAEVMDPQIRIFYECVWSALEDAGYDPGSYKGFIGLYAGAGSSVYWENMMTLSGKSEELGYFISVHLKDKDFISTQIAYRLNLKGPCFAVQTACSTSLVAIHLACQGILYGECSMALAGGVRISPQKKIGYIYQEGMISSQDGHCRAFDAKANGTVGGDGGGVVLLKSLEKAVNDGDHIYAVIKGTAINNDGLRKIGYTAPSVEGQADVIHMAQRIAEIEPETIGYIETHGTATALGDVIEIEALTLAFKTDKKNYCPIGSVKTNIGHLDAAAGVAGFIKTVLALKNRLIPPSLHFEDPNPRIDFKNSPFYVNNRLMEWKSNGTPRRAGVSSFGIGGTNAHVVLEEWAINEDRKEKNEGQGDREHRLILLSAKTLSALDRMTDNLCRYLKANRDVSLSDVAYTLMVGRKNFECRRMLLSKNVDNVIAAFSTPDSRDVHTFFSKEREKSVIFMFPGQGSQYVNMGLNLYQKESVFRREMDSCFDVFKNIVDFDIKELLYPSAYLSDQDSTNIELTPNYSDKINQTEIAQVVIFIFEYALAKLLMSWGIKPNAMIGHSIGEYTAACLSGVFSLEDALKTVVTRGRLMQKMEPGAMLSVPLSEEELKPLLNEQVSLAAVNSASHCVVSGDNIAIDLFKNKLKEMGYECSLLHTSHAFHSTMMKPMLSEFKNHIIKIEINKPKIPYISNLTGEWVAGSEIADPAYWSEHIAKTVQFSKGIEILMKQEQVVFMELGPGNALSVFLRQNKDKKNSHVVIDTVRRPKAKVMDDYYLINQIGQLWLYGAKIDWDQYHIEERRRRISLPTYPFEGKFYWFEDKIFELGKELFKSSARSLENKTNPSEWFYIPSWKSSLLPVFHADRLSHHSPWMIFYEKCPIGDLLIEKLNQLKQELIIIKRGVTYTRNKTNEYIIDPENKDDYSKLFVEREMSGNKPEKIIYLWGIGDNKTKLPFERLEIAISLSFKSLIYLAQAIGKQKNGNEIKFQLIILTERAHKIVGDSLSNPENSLALGPAKVIPLEYPNIMTRVIDIEAMESRRWDEVERIVNQLLGEFTMDTNDIVIAYRDQERLAQSFEPVWLDKREELPAKLKKEGVYWITGGVGGVGLEVGEYLARVLNAKLILTGRSEFPPKERWDQWLSKHGKEEAISRKILRLKEFEKSGAEVFIACGDISEIKSVKAIVDWAKKQFGRINGIIHAAGVPEGSIIQLKTEKMITRELSAKVKGTLALHTVLDDMELDFFLLCSSVNSILPILGQVGYCAANAYLDAFSHNRWGTHRKFTLAINWPRWEKTGMAVSLESRYEETTGEKMGGGITPAQGIDSLIRVLGNTHPQVLISTVDLNTRIRIDIENRNVKESEVKEISTPGKTLYPRPNLCSPYVAPTNEIERSLSEIGKNFLGIEELGIDDDFNELGLDSLKAITLSTKIRQIYPLITLDSLLTYSTIRELASFIAQGAKEGKSEQEICEENALKKLECVEKLNKGRNEKNIFIIHAGHGMVNQYKEFAVLVENEYNVYGIQAKGWKPGSKMSETPEQMIRDYIEEILAVQKEGPFRIGGYCVGTQIGYEIVNRLEQLNYSVERLILFDAPVVFTGSEAWLIRKLEHLPGFVERVILSINERKLKKAMRILNDTKIAGGNGEEIIGEDNILKDKIRKHLRVLGSHVFSSKIIKSPILIVQAENGPFTHLTETHFNRMTRSKSTVVRIPGDHDTIWGKPNVEKLAKLIIM